MAGLKKCRGWTLLRERSLNIGQDGAALLVWNLSGLNAANMMCKLFGFVIYNII